MRQALDAAKEAFDEGEVPVGAAIAIDGELFGVARNRVEELRDATAHAELLVLRRVMKTHRAKILPGSTLYTTLEPCLQCAGAIILARVSRLVFGARDPNAGAFGSVTDVLLLAELNHHPEVARGLFAEESSALLKTFFQRLR